MNIHRGQTHIFSSSADTDTILITPGGTDKLVINGEISDSSLDRSRGAGAYSILVGASSGVVTLNTWTDFTGTTVTSDPEMEYNSGLIGKQFTYTGSRNGVFHISCKADFQGTTGAIVEIGVSINNEEPAAVSVLKGTVPTIPVLALSGSYLVTLSTYDTIKLQFRNTNGTSALTPSILSLNFIGPF